MIFEINFLAKIRGSDAIYALLIGPKIKIHENLYMGYEHFLLIRL